MWFLGCDKVAMYPAFSLERMAARLGCNASLLTASDEGLIGGCFLQQSTAALATVGAKPAGRQWVGGAETAAADTGITDQYAFTL